MKNIKLIIGSLLVLFVISSSTAQKVKLKDLDVKVKYLTLPSIGLSKDITTYKIDLLMDESMMKYLSYTSNDVKSAIVIPGYKKVNERIGAVVGIDFGVPTADVRKLVTKAKKNKAGKKWNEYHYTNLIEQTVLVKVLDEKSNLIKDYVFNYSENTKSGTFNSKSALQKAYKSNGSKILINGRKNAVADIISQINKRLASDYGIIERNKKVEFKTLKKKKHPETPKYKKIATIVESAFTKIDFHKDLTDYKTAIQPAIDFWNKNEPGYDVKDKQQKKLKFLCRYNTALAYFWAEDFDNAKKYATPILTGDYKEKRGKKLLKLIEDTRSKIEKSYWDSRHFTIEMSEKDKQAQLIVQKERDDLIASGDIKAFPNFNTKMHVTSDVLVKKSTIYLVGGKSNDGYIRYPSDNDITPNFKYHNKILFGYLKEGEIYTGTPKYEELDSIKIEDIMYRIQDVKLVAGMMALPKMSNAIVETVKDFKRTQILIVHPPFAKAKGFMGNGGTELESELVVWNKETKKYMATKGIISGSNKALLNIVKGCSVAEEFINNYKKSKKENSSMIKRLLDFNKVGPLREALELYDTCK